MIISRLKVIRTNVGVRASSGAGAVVGKARELMTADQPEVCLDGVFVISIGDTEPDIISRRAMRVGYTRNVRVGPDGIALGAGSCVSDRLLPVRRAADVGSSFVVGTGDSKGTREVNHSNIRNSGV